MDTKTVATDKSRSTAGLLLLAGITLAAVIAGTSVSGSQVHTHCTTTGCEELGCSEHHPAWGQADHADSLRLEMLGKRASHLVRLQCFELSAGRRSL